VKVITPDVGGGFGAKISCDPEEALLGVVAKKIGRRCAGARPAASR
jgi:carbon-monoxide dehydrogenase large subunit